MKLRMLAAGTRLPDWVNAACGDYAKRFGAEIKFELVEIPVTPRGPNADLARAVAREGERMLAAIRPGDFVVAMQASGKSLSTEQLSQWLRTRLRDGRDLVLLIGGPDGLAPSCVERADFELSLSALTLPHGLARIVLIEQLYRTWSLSKGHPYHRA